MATSRRPRSRRPTRAPASAGLRSAVVRARSGRRLSAILVVYLVLTGLMGWRLVTIQVVAAEEYRMLAERQTHRQVELPARRGKLYDRAGQPLALSLVAATVYANPRALREADADPAAVAARLAPLLDRSPAALTEAMQRDVAFTYLARQVPRQTGREVRELQLPGIGVLDEPRRTYPAQALAAQVVGFAGVDNVGLSGLELEHDSLLSGTPGVLQLERAPGGLTIGAAPRQVQPPVPGIDLVLTLDRPVQFTAERVLAEALERFDAKGASAVVLDVHSGEVLAMASAPGFDAADTGNVEAFARRNRAVTDVLEPGSVNKIIPVAAAVEEGLVGLDEVFTVPDHYQVGSKRFKDSQPHAVMPWTLSEIMSHSSNVGTIMVAERVGPPRLYEYLGRFGYGQETGIGFPGESAGVVPHVDGWWATSLPTIAIGQGASATLLQVAAAYGALASGGEWVQPSLVRGTVGVDGRVEPAPAPERRRVVSAETADVLVAMLEGVIASGTGGHAAVPGYRVGGKTGTAQKPSETERGYAEGRYIATFAGLAPVEDPALVVAVMLDEPSPIWASVTAAPVFSEIMGFALRHRRVPPTDPEAVDWLAALPARH